MKILKSIAALSVCLLSALPLCADDAWPQFRGPHGAGLAADGKPGPVEFAPGKNELWKASLAGGLSSPCVWNDRIFITQCEPAAKKLETVCLQRKDGSVLWRREIVAGQLEGVHKTNSQAVATPVCDGERVYVYFGSYGLVAYNLDGTPAWELKLPIPAVMFGSAASPVLAGDFVVLNRLQGLMFGGPRKAPAATGEPAKSEVVAVQRKTGKVEWRTGISMFGMGRTYQTPAVVGSGDTAQVIVAGNGRVNALDLKTGVVTWWADKLPSVATASPIVAGDRVFLNCTGMPGDVDAVTPPSFEEALKQWDKNGDGKLQRDEIPDDYALYTRHRDDHEGDFALKQWFFGRMDADRDGALTKDEWEKGLKQVAESWGELAKPALVAIKLGGAKDVTGSNVLWTTSRGVPEVPTMIVVGAQLYSIRNGGLVTCYHTETGKVLFDQRLGASGSYYASPISDGKNVYFISQPGVVTIIRASDKFERVARIDLREDVSATPALVNGSLYLRTATQLYAFGS